MGVWPEGMDTSKLCNDYSGSLFRKAQRHIEKLPYVSTQSYVLSSGSVLAFSTECFSPEPFAEVVVPGKVLLMEHRVVWALEGEKFGMIQGLLRDRLGEALKKSLFLWIKF